MTTCYTDNDSDFIIISKNNFIRKVDLENNKNVKRIIIESCENLDFVKFNNNDKLFIEIRDCPKLTEIENTNTNNIDSYCKSVYLGEGLSNLKTLFLTNVDNLLIENQEFEELVLLRLFNIKYSNMNLSRSPLLMYINIHNSFIQNIITDSDFLYNLNVSNCKSDSLKIYGKTEKLTTLSLTNNEIDDITVKNTLNNLNELSLSDRRTCKYPYLPIKLDKDRKLNWLHLKKRNEYHISIKVLIENNMSGTTSIYKKTRNKYIECNLDNVKFYTLEKPSKLEKPKKKRKRYN